MHGIRRHAHRPASNDPTSECQGKDVPTADQPGLQQDRRRPGYTCPWEASDDGASLTLSCPYGTKEPVAEWLSYLRTHLFGPSGYQRFGRRLVKFSYDHLITGSVAVEGQTNGDKWTLSATEGGVWVDRVDLPCPACWADTLMVVRPSNAYRFTHPDPQANFRDGAYPHLDPDTYGDECLTRTWTPVGPTRRQITWPWVADVWDSWWIDLQTTPNAIPHRPPQRGLDDDRLDTHTDNSVKYFLEQFEGATDDPDDHDANEGQFDCVVLALDRAVASGTDPYAWAVSTNASAWSLFMCWVACS